MPRGKNDRALSCTIKHKSLHTKHFHPVLSQTGNTVMMRTSENLGLESVDYRASVFPYLTDMHESVNYSFSIFNYPSS